MRTRLFWYLNCLMVIRKSFETLREPQLTRRLLDKKKLCPARGYPQSKASVFVVVVGCEIGAGGA